MWLRPQQSSQGLLSRGPRRHGDPGTKRNPLYTKKTLENYSYMLTHLINLLTLTNINKSLARLHPVKKIHHAIFAHFLKHLWKNHPTPVHPSPAPSKPWSQHHPQQRASQGSPSVGIGLSAVFETGCALRSKTIFGFVGFCFELFQSVHFLSGFLTGWCFLGARFLSWKWVTLLDLPFRGGSNLICLLSADRPCGVCGVWWFDWCCVVLRDGLGLNA